MTTLSVSKTPDVVFLITDIADDSPGFRFEVIDNRRDNQRYDQIQHNFASLKSAVERQLDYILDGAN